MGVIIPQVITSDRATGAQVIDGSLKFDSGTKTHLTKTFSSSGNRQAWTWSGWVKRSGLVASERQVLFGGYEASSDTGWIEFGFGQNNETDDSVYLTTSSISQGSSAVFRDISGWYHYVANYDGSNVKIYINNVLRLTRAFSGDRGISGDWVHTIGKSPANTIRYFNGHLSQCYFIDGQTLTPTDFGFTDGLTNTWRPKKFKPQATPNDGTVWSTYGTVSGGSINTLAELFDGDLNSAVITGASSGSTITYTFTSGISYSSSVRIYTNAGGSNRAVRINSDSNVAAVAGSWVTVASGSGTMNSFSVFTGTETDAAIGAIEVDGVVLIDSDTANIGLNGFYLPFDGSAPIGQDQSGRGNDWTPVNFGGSVALDNPQVSGARPILNTIQGGTQAGVGVFGSKENKYYTVTTANGSVYQFDITSGDNPSLSFIRGATYKFDYSSFTEHPVLFSSTNPDSSTTAYTDGTSTASNVISFTVPHNAPDTLYYYCQNHPTSMNGSISITTDETKADPYAWKNVLGLPLVGVKDDVSNQINSGSTTKTITANGNVAASSAQSNFYGGSYTFDGTGDYLTVPDSADVDLTGDFTIECWFYINSFQPSGASVISSKGSDGYTVSAGNGSNAYAVFAHYGVANIVSSTFYLKTGKWYHYAVTRSGSTIRLFIDGILQQSASNSTSFSNSSVLTIGSDANNASQALNGYLQDYRIYNGVAKYTSNFIPASTNPDILPDTPSGVSGSSKLTKITDGAVSFDGSGDYLSLADSEDWNFGSGAFTVEGFAHFNGSAAQQVIVGQWAGGGSQLGWAIMTSNNSSRFIRCLISSTGSNVVFDLVSSTAFDLYKWNHFALTRSGNDFRLFIDGVLAASTTNSATIWNSTNVLTVGATSAGTQPFTGFISNLRVIKGTALYTSNFTPPTRALTNVTNTKLLCCQSPTSATAAAVSPGSITANGNAAATNFNPFTTDINTVRGQESGYATLNSLAVVGGASYSNGNLKVTGSAAYRSTPSTIGMSEGKWYVEYFFDTWVNDSHVGVMNDISPATTGTWAGNTSNGFAWAGDSGDLWTGGSTYNSSFDVSFGTGDTCQIAFDADNGRMYFGKNGVWLKGANPSAGTGANWTGLTNGPYHPFVTTTNGTICSANFGQKPFKFPPPEGFQPLNTANVRPETVIARPDQYVGIVTYASDGNSRDLILNFQPDLVWQKQLDTTDKHYWTDCIRGAGNCFRTDTADDEFAADAVTSFNTNGWTVGGGSANANQNNTTYVGWAWKAGGAPTATNTQSSGAMTANSVSVDGVLQSAYTPSGSPTIYPKKMSVGTKQGFSIVQYVGNDTLGATLPHGLTKAPDFFVTKADYDNREWQAYHKSLGNQQPIRLNTDQAAQAANAGYFNNTSPTASVVTFGNGGDANQGGETPLTYVMYAWHDVPGLQKFGSYTANGSSDGPFVFTNFRVKWLMVKGTTYTSNWVIIDAARDADNVASNQLRANLNAAELSTTSGNSAVLFDFLSNGFKLRAGAASANDVNQSGQTYIYAAWAEAPSVDLFGGGANAR